MTPRQSLLEAKQAATAQRRRLAQRAEATRMRISPTRLKADAADSAREQVAAIKNDSLAHIRAHPILVALGAVSLLAWIARKPLLKRAPTAMSRLYAWVSGNLGFSEWLANPAEDEANDGEISPPEMEQKEPPHG
ncbi:MAG: hypothetical protein ABL909_09010 [Sphingopyxis sp.]